MESRIKYVAIILCCAIPFVLKGQTSNGIYTPEVGDMLPEHAFTDLYNSSKDHIKLSDFKGKWLILDFWSKDCSGCLKSFPKMNRLHHQFKNNVEILMVGDVSDLYFESSGKRIKREKDTKMLYQRLQNLYDLQFSVAFDSTLSSYYGIRSLPYILIVDPTGVIRGITTYVDEQDISAFLKNEEPNLKKAYTGTQIDTYAKNYDAEALLYSKQDPNLIPSENKLFRSQMSIYDINTMPMKNYVDLHNSKLSSTLVTMEKGIFEISNVSLNSLFLTAHLGTPFLSHNNPSHKDFAPDCIFEVTDTLIQNKLKTPTYAYSLKIPIEKVNIDYIQENLKKDLEQYFGLKSRIEMRQTDVYNLIVIDSIKALKLKSTGEPERYKYDQNLPILHQIILNKASIDKLCSRISNSAGGKQPIVLDKTNIITNIDIDLRTYIYDFNQIEMALDEYGLGLQKGQQYMKTIVLRE